MFRLSYITLLFAGTCLLGCPPSGGGGGGGGTQQTGPTAAFTMNHSSGEAPLIVQFEDLSTQGTDTISSWSWSFSDQASGTDNVSAFQNPSHTFNMEGLFASQAKALGGVTFVVLQGQNMCMNWLRLTEFR